MKTWVDYYDLRASSFTTPEEIGCHYFDNSKICPEFSELEAFRINELLRPKPNSTVYDFGCGAGYSSMLLAKYFKSVVGLDGGETIIKKASMFNKEIKFIKDDISKLESITNNTVEYALLYGVIYNMGPIESVRDFSKNLALKCKKGSRILICKIPNSQFFETYQKYRENKKKKRKYADDSNYENDLEWLWFSPSEIKNLFGNDFEVLNVLPNPFIELPLKAWFDTILVKR